MECLWYSKSRKSTITTFCTLETQMFQSGLKTLSKSKLILLSVFLQFAIEVTQLLVEGVRNPFGDRMQVQRKILSLFCLCSAAFFHVLQRLDFQQFVTALVLFPMVSSDQKSNCKHIPESTTCQQKQAMVPGSTCQSILNTAKCTFPEDKIWKAPEKCRRTGGWKLGGWVGTCENNGSATGHEVLDIITIYSPNNWIFLNQNGSLHLCPISLQTSSPN